MKKILQPSSGECFDHFKRWQYFLYNLWLLLLRRTMHRYLLLTNWSRRCNFWIVKVAKVKEVEGLLCQYAEPNRTVETVKPRFRFLAPTRSRVTISFFWIGFLPTVSLLDQSPLIDGATPSSSRFSYEGSGSGSSSSLEKILQQSCAENFDHFCLTICGFWFFEGLRTDFYSLWTGHDVAVSE